MTEDIYAAFMNGKVQQRFSLLSRTLAEFFAATQPEIEAVYHNIKMYENATLKSIRSKAYAENLRKDAEGAQACLTTYRRTFGQVDHHLAMSASNFGLPRFLEENGIPASQIGPFQDELRELWGATYGDLTATWNQIRARLKRMHDLLEQQVTLLRGILHVDYVDGFDEAEKLRELFAQERATFYEIMTIAEKSEKGLSRLEALVSTQVKKTRMELKVALKSLQATFGKDVDAARSRSQKSLIVFLYLLGAIGAFRELRSTVIKKGLTKVVEKLLESRRESRVSLRLENVKDKANDLFSDVIEPKALLASIKAVYAAIA